MVDDAKLAEIEARRIKVWVCDKCDYWRKEKSSGVHQTNNPDDWTGKLVLHALREAEFVEAALLARVRDLEEALEFYAEMDNWTQPTSWGGRLFDPEAAAVDCGQRACAALGVSSAASGEERNG